MDGDIIQADIAQGLDVGLGHVGGCECQFFGIGTQRMVDFGQVGSAPITGDGMNKRIGFVVAVKSGDLSTEVMGMCLNSVNAVVGFTHDYGEHLALLP